MFTCQSSVCKTSMPMSSQEALASASIKSSATSVSGDDGKSKWWKRKCSPKQAWFEIGVIFFSDIYPSLHWLPIVEYVEFLLFANFNETLQIWRQNFPWRFERLFQDLSVNLSDSTKVPSIQSLQIHIKRSNDQASEWESWDGEMRKAVGTAFEYLFHHYHHNHLHHHNCTMLLSQCMWVSFEFESEYLQGGRSCAGARRAPGEKFALGRKF